jgi:hypothetical protein
MHGQEKTSNWKTDCLYNGLYYSVCSNGLLVVILFIFDESFWFSLALKLCGAFKFSFMPFSII